MLGRLLRLFRKVQTISLTLSLSQVCIPTVYLHALRVYESKIVRKFPISQKTYLKDSASSNDRQLL